MDIDETKARIVEARGVTDPDWSEYIQEPGDTSSGRRLLIIELKGSTRDGDPFVDKVGSEIPAVTAPDDESINRARRIVLAAMRHKADLDG